MQIMHFTHADYFTFFLAFMQIIAFCSIVLPEFSFLARFNNERPIYYMFILNRAIKCPSLVTAVCLVFSKGRA